MADDTDVLLELWKGQREEARQMENQRAALTTVVIAVAAAGFGFLTQQGPLRPSSLGVTLPMFMLGAFGAVACTKYGERWAVHYGQATALHRAIGLRHGSLDLPGLVAASRAEHQAEFPRISKVKIWVLWVGLHSAISAGGLVLSLCALLS
ncbi:hypothetical protein [Streptomyces sp. NPDC049040]|uniref:hypothetical protein n=1 Tax=Streptomyces sp. NPDC049040 TaxID=3365593 RepID=UPI003710DE78